MPFLYSEPRKIPEALQPTRPYPSRQPKNPLPKTIEQVRIASTTRKAAYCAAMHRRTTRLDECSIAHPYEQPANRTRARKTPETASRRSLTSLLPASPRKKSRWPERINEQLFVQTITPRHDIWNSRPHALPHPPGKQTRHSVEFARVEHLSFSERFNMQVHEPERNETMINAPRAQIQRPAAPCTQTPSRHRPAAQAQPTAPSQSHKA